MLLKRKSGDRKDWQRISKRRYAQMYLDTGPFKGYITLLQMDEVLSPLNVKYGDEERCIVNHGYCWLQQFPDENHHSVTTMFDANGEIVQWYIDICLTNGVDQNGVPWMDDLFLDIVILPSGETVIKDEDELIDARHEGIIDDELYGVAIKERDAILKKLKNEDFKIIELSQSHKSILEKHLKDE